jgi:hypothetical protein
VHVDTAGTEGGTGDERFAMVESLGRLADLHTAGMLTEEEFTRAKARILD